MNMQLAYVAWAVVFIAYVSVALMRWGAGKREDDHLHFSDSEQQLVASQAGIAHRLDVLDRWKTALLVATIFFGIAIGAAHAYLMWQQSVTKVQYS
jgi:hypothetical protein